MDRFERIQNVAMATFMGLIGALSLGAALFARAGHQFPVAVICGVMVWMNVAELRADNKTKNTKTE
jgi:ABC-type proline/glycine betaine transport system permease subunit